MPTPTRNENLPMDRCPSCGEPREDTKRFCAACGLDYWRAAAGDNTDPGTSASATAAPSRQAAPAARSAAAGSPLFIVGATLLALATLAAIVAAVVMIAGSGGPLSADEPVATPLSEEQILIRAFFRQARDPNAAFAVTGVATVNVDGLSRPVPRTRARSSVRIHGDDWMGDIAIRQRGQEPFVADAAYVDGVMYARLANADRWQQRELPLAQIGSINPFARISTVGEIEYVGAQEVDGREVHHLRVTKWLGGTDFDDLLVNIAITDQQSVLDILVANDGRPISADLTMDVTASDGVETATIATEARYRFSDWDGVDPITAPT
jgi:hypothetical protein